MKTSEKQQPETITFIGKQISFWSRFLKKITPIVLLLAFLTFRIYSNERYSENNKFYCYIFIAVCFLVGLYYHVRDIRTVVTEVRIFDDKFQVLGQDFNKKFKDVLLIKETSIELKQKEKSDKIYLEIYSNDKYYYINNYSDWDKETLVALLREFKNRTNRTIFGIALLPEVDKNLSQY